MQKRARAVESQKLRRTMKGRCRMADPIRDSMSTSLVYVRLVLLWVGVISLDMLVGFRFELLWPFWLIVRAGYEAIHKNHNTVVTLANHNSAKFSVLFVCVTATSDLICYLFIPVKFLVFLASTYVWVHLIWHTHGGFLRTISAMLYEKHCFSALVLWAFIVAFEAGIRLKCIHLELAGGGIPLFNYLYPTSCTQTQGLAPIIPRSLNSFFGAHCIGYPLVIVSFSLRYYFKEWRIRRKQDDVGRKNELLIKLLTEALPAIYEGPKDYSTKTCIEDDCDLVSLELANGGTPPMLMAPPVVANGNGTSHANGGSVKRPSVKQSSSVRQRGSARSKISTVTTVVSHNQQSTPPQKLADDKRREDDEESEASVCWRDSSRHSGGLCIVRLTWEAFLWLTGTLWPASGEEGRDDSSYGDDDDDDSLPEEQNKKVHSNCDTNKTRTVATVVRKGRGGRDGKTKEKVITTSAIEREKPNGIPLANGKAVNGLSGESSRDPSVPKDCSSDNLSTSSELERLRAEILQLKSSEADARIQLSVSQNNEKHSKQEAAQLRSRLEQMEARFATIEKLRDVDRSSLSQLEKKYAELMNRKNDVERELMAERKARKEDGGRRSDSAEQQREKERQLEREVDRLRVEAVNREERVQDIERELQALRKYKENNDVEALHMDLRIMREKMVHLEDSLAAENKLKQELFRALGDAKANNAHLQSQLRSQDCGLSVSVRPPLVSVPEKMSPSSQHVLHPSTILPPPYQMALQQPKVESHRMGNYLYTALQQHHSSPTGEHVLFEQSSSPSLPCALSPHDPLLAARMGKFGAPANPARSN